MEQTIGWDGYGRAVIDSMGDVLAEVPDGHHPVVLETADYWLSLGLSIALERPEEARALLEVIESDPGAREELRADAGEFIGLVLDR
jgi:hypothetical protein